MRAVGVTAADISGAAHPVGGGGQGDGRGSGERNFNSAGGGGS